MSQDKKAEELYKELIRNAYIPQRFQDKKLSNYKATNKNKKIYEKIQGYGRNFSEHRKEGDWLLLSGDYGLGKTHLAIGLLKLVAYYYAKDYAKRRSDYPVSIIKEKENIRAVLFKNITDMLQDIKKAYNHYEVNEDEIIWKYQTMPFLVIDDLGAEKISDPRKDGPDWKQEKLILKTEK